MNRPKYLTPVSQRFRSHQPPLKPEERAAGRIIVGIVIIVLAFGLPFLVGYLSR